MTTPIDAQKLAAYRTAVDRLPELTRKVFLLHRVDDLSYADIARHLAIGDRAVQGCIAEALSRIAAMLDGENAEGPS